MKTEQVTPQNINEFKSILNSKLIRIFDELLEGVQILDFDLNFLYINKAAEKQNQRPNNELLGKSYKDIWPGIENTKVYKLIRQSLDEQLSIQFENEFFFTNGSKGCFYLSIQPITEGLLILSLDITSRMILGQENVTNEKLYQSLFDNQLNGFAFCKMEYEDDKPLDFIYLSVNKAFEKLTGLVNVIGKKISEVVPGIQDSDPQLLKTYDRVATTGIPETFEIYLESLKMWFSVSVYSPETGYFVAIFDVITERKNTEKKLLEQLEELQRWYSATIDREQRSIELKKEVNQLLIEFGKPPKYTLIDKTEDHKFDMGK